MKYFSLFSGIGGFEVGIQNAIPYAECVGFCEIDKYAKSIYQKHFKNHKDYGDVTKINEQELPEFDCLVGGFPCQPFSIAGARQGFTDTRGTLFFDIERILRAKRPRMFVLENVKGLLSHDSGKTFRVIIGTLDELGYDVGWQVLNSKNYGVPQNRERVFIAGHFRASGGSGRQIFPLGKSTGKDIGLRSNKNQAAQTITARYGQSYGTGSYIGRENEVRLQQIVGGSQAHRVYDSSGISCTLAAQAGGLGAKTGLYAIPTLVPERENIRQSRRFKIDDKNAYTVCASTENGVYTQNKIRRLTPKECERLQGFPDDWTKYGINKKLMSDSARYKACGNAVTVNIVYTIFEEIKSAGLIDKKTKAKKLIPKVVSFSGGRTSGMMLLQMLENNELQQWRGDCVVFSNTSAEHFETYNFVRRLKKICEEKYNIPFFILEFCTYEAKTSRGYVRRKSYRLVNERKFSDSNPGGYKNDGEVFEEMLSHSGTLPSTFQRTCTTTMKIEITNKFLQDWWSGVAYIEELGHRLGIKISEADIVAKHRRHRGELSDEAIIDKKEYSRTSQTFREKQFFQNFTSASTQYSNQYLTNNLIDGKIKLFGKKAIKYHNYLGIRFDEKHRATKIRERIKESKLNLTRQAKNKNSKVRTQPPFELAQMPMIKSRITTEKVIGFWKSADRSKYDLLLPFDGSMSNCVHCFLKGKSKNQLIAKRLKNDSNTPLSLKWWGNVERKYSRKVIKHEDNDYTNIGFFGVSKDYVYQSWFLELNHTSEKSLISTQEKQSYNMDCNCTD